MKKLSVVVAAYNVENEIKRCLTSLKAQTINDVEFLIINDSSTDNTESVILHLLKQFDDHRFKYIKKKNEGISEVRNFGILKSNAEYLYFVDGDDEISNPIFLELLVKYLENNKLDVIEFNYQLISNSDKKNAFENRNTSSVESGKKLFYQSIKNNKYASYVWHYAFRKKFLTENQFKFKKGIYIEDVLFMIPLLITAKRSMYLNEIGYNYIQRNESITNRKNKITRKKLVKDHLYVLESINKYLHSQCIEKEYMQKYNDLILRAYLVNLIKAVGYDIPLSHSEVSEFIFDKKIKKDNKVKLQLLKLPSKLRFLICKLIVKVRP